MGYILSASEGASSKVHGESRRESFVLCTDYRKDRIELEWHLLPHLIKTAKSLKKHHEKEGWRNVHSR